MKLLSEMLENNKDSDEEKFARTISELRRGDSSRNSMNETPIRSGSHSVKKGDRDLSQSSSARTKLKFEESSFGKAVANQEKRKSEVIIQEEDYKLAEVQEREEDQCVSNFTIEPDGVRSPFFGTQARISLVFRLI